MMRRLTVDLIRAIEGSPTPANARRQSSVRGRLVGHGDPFQRPAIQLHQHIAERAALVGERVLDAHRMFVIDSSIDQSCALEFLQALRQGALGE